MYKPIGTIILPWSKMQHWGWEKITTILQMTISNAFSSMKIQNSNGALV